ncbi:MAG TPA: hypothetical protein VFN09_08510 [Rhodanobacteraceae bacterium]|nr:hypothetical protein [Rhodanobacteraceae bacterium]
MPTYSLHKANFEMLLILASRSLSDLALQLARQAGEEVGPLPTKAQFDRALAENQTQADWLQAAMEAYLDRAGKLRDDPAPASPA